MFRVNIFILSHSSHKFDFEHFPKQSQLQLVPVTLPAFIQVQMLSPKPKSILDTMASQKRSNLSIPDDPVIPLPGKSKKNKPKPDPATKPAYVSVLVETIPTGDNTKPSASASASNDTITLFNVPDETVPAPRGVAQVDITGGTTTNSTDSDNDDKNDNKNDPDDWQPSNYDSTNDNDKKNDKKKNDKSSPTTPPSSTDLSTHFCMFVFDTDHTCPLLAQRLNDGYDLLFDIDDILESDGSFPLDSSFMLRAHLKYLLLGQAVATGDSTDDGYMSTSRQLIIKTITDSLTFSCDMGKAKGLLRSQRSLEIASTYAKRSKVQLFHV